MFLGTMSCCPIIYNKLFNEIKDVIKIDYELCDSVNIILASRAQHGTGIRAINKFSLYRQVNIN